jgi:hypothetical protein
MYNPVESDGFRAPSPYSMYYANGSTCPVGMSTYYHLGSTLVRNDGHLAYMGVQPMSYGTIPYETRVALELKARLDVRNKKVELGASIGERKDTAEMFQDALGRVGRAFGHFRRKRFKQAARELGIGYRSAPNNWLAWQYGWAPLLDDVHKACTELNRKDNENPERTILKAKAKDSVTTVTTGDEYAATGVREFWKMIEKKDCAVRFYYTVDTSQDFFRKLDEWGVLNPASIAWELIPFSFVVDWALPIGDYINALTSTVGYSFRGGCRTEFVTRTLSSTYRGVPDGVAQDCNTFAKAGWTTKRFIRSTYPYFPYPDIEGIANLQSTEDATVISTRVANGLSILASGFSGGKS